MRGEERDVGKDSWQLGMEMCVMVSSRLMKAMTLKLFS